MQWKIAMRQEIVLTCPHCLTPIDNHSKRGRRCPGGNISKLAAILFSFVYLTLLEKINGYRHDMQRIFGMVEMY